MRIPSNGRVVIIDDKTEEEALPLIAALSRKGVAFRYFTGSAAELPAAPVAGVRLVFLDLKLAGMEFETDTENIVNSLRPVLERIVSAQNGPWGIIGWTKTPAFLARLSEVIQPRPLFAIDLEKSSCMREGVCDLALIEQRLEALLPRLGPFEVLFRWENLVNESSFATLNRFNDFFPPGAEAIPGLAALLFRLGKANVGKHMGDLPYPDRILQAAQAFNEALADSLESGAASSTFDGIDLRLEPPPSRGAAEDVLIDARVNARFHIASDQSAVCIPGNAYESYNAETIGLLDAMLLEFGKLAGNKTAEQLRAAGVRAYILEVSPVCDHAQKKWKRHRIVPLIAVPDSVRFNLDGRPESLYLSPKFFLDSINASSAFSLMADTRFLTSVPFTDLTGKRPVFRLRKELTHDVQALIARHANRPGIISL